MFIISEITSSLQSPYIPQIPLQAPLLGGAGVGWVRGGSGISPSPHLPISPSPHLHHLPIFPNYIIGIQPDLILQSILLHKTDTKRHIT